jgi:hypothetical protein
VEVAGGKGGLRAKRVSRAEGGVASGREFLGPFLLRRQYF